MADNKDKKFFIEQGDPGFSPARNKAIIDGTIRKYEKMREQKAHEQDDAIAERASAVVAYLKWCMRKPGYRLDQYFSKQEIEHLMGLDLRLQLMNNMRIVREKKEIERKSKS